MTNVEQQDVKPGADAIADDAEDVKLVTLPNGVLFNRIPENKADDQKDANAIIEEDIDYKNIEFLMKYVSEGGRIMSRRYTGLTPKQQRKLSKCVKRARQLSLMMYSANA